MLRSIILLVILIVTVTAVLADAIPSHPVITPLELSAYVPSLTGLTGLIRVPTANTLGDGNLRLSYNAVSGPPSPNFGGVSKYGITIGILPHLETSVTMGNKAWGRDFTAHAKWQCCDETARFPAIAVGITDLKRTHDGHDPTGILVITKHLAHERLGLTVGAAEGYDHGVLGGASYQIGNILRLKTEYDTKHVNSGIDLTLPHGVISLEHHDDATTMRYAVQMNLAAPKPLVGPPVQDLSSRPDDLQIVERVRTALEALNLENIQVTLAQHDTTRVLAVSFENRQYALNDQDSVAEVFPLLASFAPPNITTFSLTLTHRGIPVETIMSGADSYRRFVAGSETRAIFTRQLHITQLTDRSAPSTILATSGRSNSVYGHSELLIGPGLITELGSDNTNFAAGLSARVETITPVTKGLLLNSRWSYPLAGTLVSDESRRWKTDRLAMSYAFRPTSGILAQTVAGTFPGHYAGAVGECAVPLGARTLFHATGGYLHSSVRDRRYGVADIWQLFPAQHVQLRLLGGEFLDGDTGYGADLVRYFHEIRVGLGVRKTSASRLALVQISVPLSPRRQPLPPSLLRPRTPSFYDFQQESAINGSNYLYLANTTANELSTGVDLLDTMLNRNRSLPAEVRENFPR